MVQMIQGNTAVFDQARKLAIRGASDISLVRGLGSGAGLSRASEVLLAGVSGSTGKLAAAQETIQSRIQHEGGLELARKLAPQLVAFVALEPNQFAVPHSSHDPRDFRLADPRVSLDQQRSSHLL